MKTLHAAYRVTDLDGSLAFYTALGYDQVGRVDLGDGASLTMLKFPGEDVVALELVHRPPDGSVDRHRVQPPPIQVDDLDAVIGALRESGLRPGLVERPGGSARPSIAWLRTVSRLRNAGTDDPIASLKERLPIRRRCPGRDPHITCGSGRVRR